MGRWIVAAVTGVGLLLIAAAVIAPLVGIGIGLSHPGYVATYVIGVPRPLALLSRSLTLAVVATCIALLLGLAPAALLGSSKGSRLAVLTGLVLAPLLVPPQVYAYAWQLALAPNALIGRIIPTAGGAWIQSVLKAGVISGGWLWPIVALVVGAGWRSAGQSVYRMAVLDTTPARAFWRAVLPTLRAHLVAAACLVFAISMIEFAIPHLMLASVYSTVLQLLVDAGAPPRQVILTAAGSFAVVCVLIGWATWSLRGLRHWQAVEDEDPAIRQRLGWWVWSASALAWLLSVGAPAGIMLAWLKIPSAWREGFYLFGRVWLVSLGVSLAAAAGVVMVAIATSLLRTAVQSTRRRASLGVLVILVMLVSLIPAAALGRGFTLSYNHAGVLADRFPGTALGWIGESLADLYAETPLVWIAGMVARYAAIGVLVVWLAWGRRSHAVVEQARADGADAWGLMAGVVIPSAWPSLAAAGLIVAVLALFEVMITQSLSPPAYPSIGMSILNQMHYGRDDVVITTSLMVMVAGILLTQVCGWLLVGRQR